MYQVKTYIINCSLSSINHYNTNIIFNKKEVTMDILKILNRRYATKKFDTTKKLSDDKMDAIKTILQMSPSSTNLQPWHFIIATTEQSKERISRATQGLFAFNEEKVLEASAVVVFTSRADITEDYLAHILGQEDLCGRFVNQEIKDNSDSGRKIFSDIHKYEYKDLQHWCDKQVYINLGNFLLAVATMGIDAVPMEGFDRKILDEEFGLHEMGFTSSVIVGLGYHDENDFNAKLPKARLSKDDIISRI